MMVKQIKMVAAQGFLNVILSYRYDEQRVMTMYKEKGKNKVCFSLFLPTDFNPSLYLGGVEESREIGGRCS